jgi:hypothetical protein
MSMSDKNRMFVAQSNDNEYLYQDHSGNLGRMLYRYYSQKDAQNAIERAGRTNQCHVVELIEAPVKVVVSEDEAKMLDQAKCDDDPAELIVGFVNSRDNYDDDRKAEDRLMRAYVNGWTVDKPNRYVLPMEGTKLADGTIAYATLDHTGVWTIKAYSKKQSAVAFHNTVTKSDIDAAPDWVKSIKAVEVAEHDDEGA